MGESIEGDASVLKLESLRKQYDVYVDLFKFYLDMTLKTTIWFYTVTGAILAFYFKVETPNKVLIYALLLPCLLSGVLTGIFLLGAMQARRMQQELNSIRDTLKIEGAPHVSILIWSLVLFSVSFLIVGIFMLIYIYGHLPAPLHYVST